MLSYFPARDLDEPASKDYIESRIAEVQLHISNVEVRLTRSTHDEINGLRAETVGGLVSLRTEMTAQIHALSTNTDKQMAGLNTKIDMQVAGLNTKIDKQGERLDAKIEALDTKIDQHRDRTDERFDKMDSRITHQTQLMVALIVAVPSIIATLPAFIN